MMLEKERINEEKSWLRNYENAGIEVDATEFRDVNEILTLKESASTTSPSKRTLSEPWYFTHI